MKYKTPRLGKEVSHHSQDQLLLLLFCPPSPVCLEIVKPLGGKEQKGDASHTSHEPVLLLEEVPSGSPSVSGGERTSSWQVSSGSGFLVLSQRKKKILKIVITSCSWNRNLLFWYLELDYCNLNMWKYLWNWEVYWGRKSFEESRTYPYCLEETIGRNTNVNSFASEGSEGRDW